MRNKQYTQRRRSQGKVSADVSAKDSESQNKKCLSLQKRKPLSNMANQSRYASPCTEEEMLQAAKGVVPVNTECSNRWALRTWNGQRTVIHLFLRNENLFESHLQANICICLCFKCEKQTAPSIPLAQSGHC